jgi:hypothetical protein
MAATGGGQDLGSVVRQQDEVLPLRVVPLAAGLMCGFGAASEQHAPACRLDLVCARATVLEPSHLGRWCASCEPGMYGGGPCVSTMI